MDHKFEPYQKVLARDSIGVWRAKFFSNYTEDNKYFCTDDMEWEMCIPYEGNEHLLGTTDDLKEEQNFEFGQKVRCLDKWSNKRCGIFVEKRETEAYPFCVLTKDTHSFVWFSNCEASEW